MNSVFDIDNNPLTHVAVNLSENGVWTFTVGVPCVAGMFLAADVPEDAQSTVSARITGSGDPFVDIADTPISLTPHANTITSFDIKIVAGDVPGLARVAIPVRVTFNP